MGQGKETNVEANNNSGGRGAGRPVRHKIPLVILIFLVWEFLATNIESFT